MGKAYLENRWSHSDVLLGSCMAIFKPGYNPATLSFTPIIPFLSAGLTAVVKKAFAKTRYQQDRRN